MLELVFPTGGLNGLDCLFLEFITKVKDKAESVQQKIQSKTDQQSGGKRPPSNTTKRVTRRHESKRRQQLNVSDGNLTMEIAQLYMSCLHAWGLDPDLDKLCHSKLGLLRPRCPISFGLLSRGDHMSLLLPGWQKLPSHIVKDEPAEEPVILAEQTTPVDVVIDPVLAQIQKSCSRGHWLISSAVSTQHLLSVISTANTLMSMSRCSFPIGRHLGASR